MKENIRKHEEFKSNLEPQLENARKEIELNKSMLIMLNNEINVINQEKLQLEKRLLNNNRRLKTPSVIIEEEEDDLVEEQYDIKDKILNNDLIKINNDKSVDLIMQSSKDIDGVLILNKQIEDMTFYIDELKSELEAEREKNVEINNELIKNRNQLNEFITNLNNSTNEMNHLKFENEKLSKDMNTNMINLKSEQDSIDISINKYTNDTDTDIKLKHVDNVVENLDNKLKTVLKIVINEVIDNDNYDTVFKNLHETYNDNELNSLLNDLAEKYKHSIEKRENFSKSTLARLSYIETQMEKVIKDYKIEIENLQNEINSKDIEFNNYKIEVIIYSNNDSL